MPASPFVDSNQTKSKTCLDPGGGSNKKVVVSSTHPILIVEHHRVGCGEVDAQSTSTRAQKEEPWRVWAVAARLEAIHLRAAFQRTRRTVYAAQWPVFKLVRPVLQRASLSHEHE